MDRRTAISRIGIMLGGTLSASTLSALMSGCTAPPEEGFRPQFLSSSQLDRLERIVDMIIPETDTPGARQAGVHRFIDTLLAEYYPKAEAQQFHSLFNDWATTYRLDEQSDEELFGLLSEMDRRWAEEGPSGDDTTLWGQLKSWTVSGYYTSEIGMTQELRMKPYAEARMDMPRSDIERTWAN